MNVVSSIEDRTHATINMFNEKSLQTPSDYTYVVQKMKHIFHENWLNEAQLL